MPLEERVSWSRRTFAASWVSIVSLEADQRIELEVHVSPVVVDQVSGAVDLASLIPFPARHFAVVEPAVDNQIPKAPWMEAAAAEVVWVHQLVVLEAWLVVVFVGSLLLVAWSRWAVPRRNHFQFSVYFSR